MSIFEKPWPTQVVWVTQAVVTVPVAVMFSVIPAFALRMTAVIFHLFHPVTAGVCGAVTGAAVYLLLNSESMTGQPMVADLHDLLLFSIAGAIAGFVWLWVERLGTSRE